MKRRIDYIPAIIMLLASFTACIFTIIYKYELTESMIVIMVTAIIFFIAGCIIKGIASKYLIIKMKEETDNKQSDDEEDENSLQDEVIKEDNSDNKNDGIQQ